MEKFKLNDMLKGWFIGNFEPSIIKTDEIEVGVKEYLKGDKEDKHFHKLAIEITVVNYGKICMNNKVFKKGDIVVIRPNETCDFMALEDTSTTVIKYPGASNDKYIVNE